MSKLRLAAAAAIACAVTLLSSGAQAYPDCGVNLSLNGSTLVGGKTLTFKADAGSTDCDWTVTYRGETQTGSGTSISGSFSTPKVSKKTKDRLIAHCEHVISDSASASASASTAVTPALYSGQASAVLPAVQTTVCSIDANVTLLPKGAANEDDGALPDTGGSNLWLLVLGGALVVGGGGVTYAARRRHSSH